MNAPACTICNRGDGPLTHTKATGWRCSTHRPDPLAHLLETLRRWVEAREHDTGREDLAAHDVEHAYRQLQDRWALHRAAWAIDVETEEVRCG